MRRRAFTLVEIMVVVVLIGILLAIAVPQWRTIRQSSQEKACAGNRDRIQKGKNQWILDTGQDGNATPTFVDLVPVYIKQTPECPANGIYDIADGNTQCSCSVHGS
jgi:prepilin-type N-terminal cleavage/methylation domain-containing protein